MASSPWLGTAGRLNSTLSTSKSEIPGKKREIITTKQKTTNKKNAKKKQQTKKKEKRGTKKKTTKKKERRLGGVKNRGREKARSLVGDQVYIVGATKSPEGQIKSTKKGDYSQIGKGKLWGGEGNWKTQELTQLVY